MRSYFANPVFCLQHLNFATRTRSKFVFVSKIKHTFFYIYVYNVFKSAIHDEDHKILNLSLNVTNSLIQSEQPCMVGKEFSFKYNYLDKVILRKNMGGFLKNLENIPKQDKISYFIDSFDVSGLRYPGLEKQVITLQPSKVGRSRIRHFGD